MAGGGDRGLGVAIRNRTVLGQATGLVMAQDPVGAGQAIDLMRRLSSEQNRKLISVAQEIVATHECAVVGERTA